jgi:hypothetical protein
MQDSPLMKWLQQELKKCPETEADRTRLATILQINREALCRQQRGEHCCPATDQGSVKNG